MAHHLTHRPISTAFAVISACSGTSTPKVAEGLETRQLSIGALNVMIAPTRFDAPAGASGIDVAVNATLGWPATPGPPRPGPVPDPAGTTAAGPSASLLEARLRGTARTHHERARPAPGDNLVPDPMSNGDDEGVTE